MGWNIHIEDKADFELLQSLIRASLNKANENISIYVERAIQLETIKNALESAEYIKPEKAKEEPVVKKGKFVARGKTPAVAFNLCDIHPLYGAKRAPRTECPGCWAAYEKLHDKLTARQARAIFEKKSGKTVEVSVETTSTVKKVKSKKI